ncbi:MAG: hypothetical protein P4L81_05680 [Candidatus Pacebacteria bacterium]|nr:hypothetical protein [Candidatus Paceibacterota bacterium]
MLTIANVRRAASELSQAGLGVTGKRLARKLGCSCREMNAFVQGRQLHKELNSFNADLRFPGLVLMQAAELIRQRGELVTYQALAEQTGIQRRAITMIFLRHPDWVHAVGVLTAGTAHFLTRTAAYKTAVKVRGCNTVPELERECGINRSMIYKDLRTVGSLESLLRVEG